jgi:pyoverdine/dityrosine biosynthesis protein Dit1
MQPILPLEKVKFGKLMEYCLEEVCWLDFWHIFLINKRLIDQLRYALAIRKNGVNYKSSSLVVNSRSLNW